MFLERIIRNNSRFGILLAVLTVFSVAAFSASAEGCIRGDANGDGNVDIRDVTQIQRKLAQFPVSSFNEEAADVDGNGLDINDAASIQRYLAEYDDPYRIGGAIGEEPQPRMFYYSSLSLAVSDANALSTANSDLETVDGAAAVVSVETGTAHIRLITDSVDTPALEINSKVEFDLNNKTLGFADANGITYHSDLTISNGSINAVITDCLISQGNNTDSSLDFSNVTMGIEFDGSGAQKRLSVIKASKGTVRIDNTIINAVVVNDSYVHSYTLLSESGSVISNITDSAFDMSSDEALSGEVYCFDLKGEANFSRSEINVDLSVDFSDNPDLTRRVYGLFCTGKINSDDSKIVMNVIASGNSRRITSAFANADASGNGETIVSNTDVTINYNTTNTGIEVAHGFTVPYDGLIKVEDSTITINSIAGGADTTNMKRFAGVFATAENDQRIILKNNDLRLHCHLVTERTDAANKIYQTGYHISKSTVSSVSDKIYCTTDTIYNNTLRSYAMNVSNSDSVEIDNIDAFVTSQPSYVPGSDGATACIRFISSNVSITDDNGTNYVHGSHSGISASGDNMNLTVHGGTYESPTHGGFYFMGANGSTLVLDRVNSLNTQNFTEHFDHELLDVQGALYISDFGCTASISNSYIYGGKFGLRIKYYQKLDGNGQDTNTAHHADVTVDDTYIYGDNVGIHDDLFPGMGVLTVGENVTIDRGGLDPEHSYDIWTWRGADVIDNRKDSNANDLSDCEREDVVYNVENEYVQTFLANAPYDPLDYSYSLFEPDESANSEANESDTVSPDKPAWALIDVPTDSVRITFTDKSTGKWWSERTTEKTYIIRNLVPGHTYDYVVRDSNNKAVKYGTITAQGTLRMVDGGGNTFNIRDIGGWQANGGTLKYGLLYRGCELNGNTFKVTLDIYHKKYFEYVLGIKSEIDLRSYSETQGVSGSAISDNVEYNHYIIPAYAVGLDLQDRKYNYTGEYRDVLKKIAHNINEGKPTYCHCLVGADRTGTFMYLIEALCGVSQSDIDRDYELTSFSGETRLRTNERYQTLVSIINKMKGNTLQEKAVSYALKIGVTIEEINMLRNGLVDGEPAEICENSVWSDDLFDMSSAAFESYIDSSGELAEGEQGQLVTDYIPVTQNTLVNLSSDISQIGTTFTGTFVLYDSDKNYIAQASADKSVWAWNSDRTEGSCPVWTAVSWENPLSIADTYYVRLCVAYEDVNNIKVKTKEI